MVVRLEGEDWESVEGRVMLGEWELGAGCWIGSWGEIMGTCSDEGRFDGRRAHAEMLKMEWLR
jgi:hypothetical protein